MDKRKRIGLVCSSNENWTAIYYYLRNFILALKTENIDNQPLIYFFGSEKSIFQNLKNETQYLNLHFWEINNRLFWGKRIVNKLLRPFKGRNIFEYRPTEESIDILFPNPSALEYFFALIPHSKRVFWIPDFQEKYYPNLFSKEELNSRADLHQQLSSLHSNIVFSSYNALKDYEKFYPENNSVKHILQFAVSNQMSSSTNIEILKFKFNINGDYFISPNQMWVHKNHETLIYGFCDYLKHNPQSILVFTGKENDYRAPKHTEYIKELVNKLDIKSNVRFLGFIDHLELLILMKFSKAVIQPSLFEGWSTVIEDAKSLNCLILASKIEVNYEQLETYPNKSFFEPTSVNSIKECLLNCPIEIVYYDYSNRIIEYKNAIFSLIEKNA